MIKLLNQDCISGLETMDDKFDLVVTSPPYNAGKEYEGDKSWSEYENFAKAWTGAVASRLNDDGSLWINVGYFLKATNQAIPLTYLYYQACPLKLVQEIVWRFEGGMSYSNRFSHRTERWMWFSKNPDKANFNLDAIRTKTITKDRRNNPAGKNPGDCWYYNRVTNNSPQKHGHPCQFPEDMITRVILACSDKGDLVLDPFMGSGTTGVVSKIRGRSFVGFETNPGYFAEARKRMDKIVFALE